MDEAPPSREPSPPPPSPPPPAHAPERFKPPPRTQQIDLHAFFKAAPRHPLMGALPADYKPPAAAKKAAAPAKPAAPAAKGDPPPRRREIDPALLKAAPAIRMEAGKTPLASLYLKPSPLMVLRPINPATYDDDLMFPMTMWRYPENERVTREQYLERSDVFRQHLPWTNPEFEVKWAGHPGKLYHFISSPGFMEGGEEAIPRINEFERMERACEDTKWVTKRNGERVKKDGQDVARAPKMSFTETRSKQVVGVFHSSLEQLNELGGCDMAIFTLIPRAPAEKASLAAAWLESVADFYRIITVLKRCKGIVRFIANIEVHPGKENQTKTTKKPAPGELQGPKAPGARDPAPANEQGEVGGGDLGERRNARGLMQKKMAAAPGGNVAQPPNAGPRAPEAKQMAQRKKAKAAARVAATEIPEDREPDNPGNVRGEDPPPPPPRPPTLPEVLVDIVREAEGDAAGGLLALAQARLARVAAKPAAKPAAPPPAADPPRPNPLRWTPWRPEQGNYPGGLKGGAAPASGDEGEASDPADAEDLRSDESRSVDEPSAMDPDEFNEFIDNLNAENAAPADAFGAAEEIESRNRILNLHTLISEALTRGAGDDVLGVMRRDLKAIEDWHKEMGWEIPVPRREAVEREELPAPNENGQAQEPYQARREEVRKINLFEAKKLRWY